MKKRKASYNYKKRITQAFLLIFLVWAIATAIKNGNKNKELYRNGKITNAIITKTRKVGGKGTRRCTYIFYLNGTKYDGWVDNDSYEVGDTIQIMFLRNNPEVNNGRKFLERYN